MKARHTHHRRPHKTGATHTDVRSHRPAESSVRAERDARGQNAIQNQQSWLQQLDAWLGHHSHSSIDSLFRLLETPVQSLMTWLVISIAIVLPAAMFLVFDNVQQLSHSWQDSSQISVFMKKDTSSQTAQQLAIDWKNRSDVMSVVYVSPDQALEEFKQSSGLGDLVTYLDENPLPSVLIITPKLLDNNPESLTSLQQTLIANPHVADVRLDLLWVKRLHQFIRITERFLWSLSFLLLLGVLLVIGNSIHAAVEKKHDEILVSKLVGATNAYVRRPFLYMGLWYGLIGGFIASLLLAVVFYLLDEPVTQLANLYQSSFKLRDLRLVEALQLMLMAGVIGLLGAALSLGRHLRQIQPR